MGRGWAGGGEVDDGRRGGPPGSMTRPAVPPRVAPWWVVARWPNVPGAGDPRGNWRPCPTQRTASPSISMTSGDGWWGRDGLTEAFSTEPWTRWATSTASLG